MVNNISTNNSSSISDEAMKAIIAEGEKVQREREQNSATIQTTKSAQSRKFIVIGTGDGGCNIASDIKKRVPEVYAIVYNTSGRAIKMLNVDGTIVPNAEDGSGKDRSYSKEVFRHAAHSHLLKAVRTVCESGDYDYILITTTTDGGTGGGASPNIARYVADNIDLPVIILGVYPALAEDGKAQYNCLAWQTDVEKTQLPYIIYDNNARATLPKLAMHSSVNSEIVDGIAVLTGAVYGNTNISAIDNRDMHMMLVEAGKRITIMSSYSKPKVGQTLDDFLIEKITDSAQPNPSGYTAIGLFIKGPKSFINSVDTSMFAFREHFGDALLYTHIEESDELCISVITAGNDLPELRMEEIKERYNDIANNMRKSNVTAQSVFQGLEDPFSIRKSSKKPPVDVGHEDSSALDL